MAACHISVEKRPTSKINLNDSSLLEVRLVDFDVGASEKLCALVAARQIRSLDVSNHLQNHVLDLSTLSIVQEYTGSITFMGESAGYRNTLGMYEIMPDGSIDNIEIIYANASAAGSGGDLVRGTSKVDVEFAAGSTVGFFIIPNGAGYYATRLLLEDDSSQYEFRDSAGNVATTSSDDRIYLWHIGEDGTETLIRGAGSNVSLHSYKSDDDEFNLNGDNIDHTKFVYQVADDRAVLDMNFEDIYGGGDRDYNDVMFRLDIGPANIQQAIEDSVQADLTITDIRVDDNSLEDGEHLYARIDIQNIGGQEAEESSSTFYWSPTDVFDLETAQALKVEYHSSLEAGEEDWGETVRVKYDDMANFGAGYIFAQIDPNNEISEFDETNNLSEGVFVDMPDRLGLADLNITDIGTSDNELSKGEDLFVTFDVNNDGDVLARNVSTTFYWSATDTFDAESAVRLSTDNQATIKAGKTDANEVERLRFETLAEHGDGFIFGVVDDSDNIEESDEANNVSEALEFTIDDWTGTAELRVDSISYGGDQPVDGSDLFVHVDVANDGDILARSARTTFYWSETDTFDADSAVRLATEHHGTLSAGEMDTDEVTRIRFEAVAELGSGYIFGVIDPDNLIEETDEANNVSEALAVTIPDNLGDGLAELSIVSLGADTSVLADGEDLEVALSVTNTGEAKARQVTTTLYWHDSDTFDFDTAHELTSDRHGTLREGEIDDHEGARVDYDALADLGSGYIFGFIDSPDTTAETNELNNISDGLEFHI